MTSYQIDPGPQSVAVGRFLDGVRRELLEAFLNERQSSGLTIQDLSRKLLKPCSEINGYLAGTLQLSLRAIADLAWALDRSISLDVGIEKAFAGQNEQPVGMTVHYRGTYRDGLANELTTTAPPPPVIRVCSVMPVGESSKA